MVFKWLPKEFSKRLLLFSWTITLGLTVILVYCSLKCLPTDALCVVAPLAWAETATATGYYYWKAKNENRAKYAQKFVRDLASEYDTETALRVAEIVLKD